MNKSILLEKSIKFALRIVRFYRYLSEEKQEFVLSKQVLLSGTYIAKFVKEANYAESKPVFSNDLQNALKRATETEFWLLILHKASIWTKKPIIRSTKIVSS